MPRGWDGGRPVSARGRFPLNCVAGATTTLAENPGGGALGDELDWLWLYPADTTPGAVSLLDGATVRWSWPPGIILTDNRPIFVPLNLRSTEGAWSLALPVDVAALAAGAFA